MPLILGAQSAVAGGYDVANSCRFNGVDSTLSKTYGGAGNVDKWTLSMWIKRSDGYLSQNLFHGGSGTTYTMIRYQGGGATYPNAILFENYVGGVLKGQIKTLAGWRDQSAWYHYVFVWDSGNASAGDRMRIYVNGAELTSLGSDVNPAQDQDSSICAALIHEIGGAGSEPFNGYMAQLALCDGQTYTPSDFGEFNEDSPTVWQPINISGLTFGTNGIYLDFGDSAALGNDVSGNNNDYAENNITTVNQGTDTPTNNFATWNPLIPNYTVANNATYEEGNLYSETTTTGGLGGISTIGSDVSKWYAEIKLIYESTVVASCVGVYKNPWDGLGGNSPHDSNKFYGMISSGTKYTATVATGSWGASYAAGDIMSLALDVDNQRLYIAKNGLWCDGAGAFDQASPTAYVTLSSGDEWFFGCGDSEGGGVAYHSANFGNPPYANVSDAPDENGFGAFEYTPPTGYLAFCTKNLATDGG